MPHLGFAPRCGLSSAGRFFVVFFLTIDATRLAPKERIRERRYGVRDWLFLVLGFCFDLVLAVFVRLSSCYLFTQHDRGADLTFMLAAIAATGVLFLERLTKVWPASALQVVYLDLNFFRVVAGVLL